MTDLEFTHVQPCPRCGRSVAAGTECRCGYDGTCCLKGEGTQAVLFTRAGGRWDAHRGALRAEITCYPPDTFEPWDVVVEALDYRPDEIIGSRFPTWCRVLSCSRATLDEALRCAWEFMIENAKMERGGA